MVSKTQLTQLLISIILIILGNTVFAQPFRHEIPFRYGKDSRYILVEAIVNGNPEKKTFIFDTGGFNVLNQNRVELPDSKGRAMVSLQLGELTLESESFIVQDWSTLFASSKFMTNLDGMIGSDLMDDFFWKIDYQKKILVVSNSVTGLLQETQPDYTIPFSTFFKLRSHPMIKVKVAGQSVKCAFDTGSPGEISLYDKYFHKLRRRNPSLKYTTDTVATISYYTKGQVKKTKRYTAVLQDGNIGDLKLKNQTVKFSQFGLNVIGNKFWEGFIVILDWRNKLIYLKKATKER